MAQRDWQSWPPLLVANVWTRYGTWWVLHFGLGLLLRAATTTQPDDYLGFWGWFLLVSLAAFGYGVWRYRHDTALGIEPRPISRAEHWLAGLVLVSAVLIVWFTDNSTSARMPGRYAVGVLVASFIVLDWAQVPRSRRVGAEGLEPPTPSL